MTILAFWDPNTGLTTKKSITFCALLCALATVLIVETLKKIKNNCLTDGISISAEGIQSYNEALSSVFGVFPKIVFMEY